MIGLSSPSNVLHGRFARPDEPADVAVLVVTYNNARDVEPLIASLRSEAGNLRIRVVIADNDSEDGTLSALRRHPDLIAVATGGNLGYAGGINIGRKHVGTAEAVLVLNPDLRVKAGAIGTLLKRLRECEAGIVVPLLEDDNGVVFPSIRREPALAAAFGDAFLGSKCSWRPKWLSETEHGAAAYASARIIDWATGAALLIRSDLANKLGDWDERFFLYSEETEYCRRARLAGAQIWFEPAARMVHRCGGSGSSPELSALLCVNRLRYAELTRSRAYAAAFRIPVILGEVLRSYSPKHRRSLWALMNRRRWSHLPHATGCTAAEAGA